MHSSGSKDAEQVHLIARIPLHRPYPRQDPHQVKHKDWQAVPLDYDRHVRADNSHSVRTKVEVRFRGLDAHALLRTNTRRLLSDRALRH